MMPRHEPMNDKEREFVRDQTSEYLSDCCNATLLSYNDGTGLCSDCKEWSSGYTEEEK